MKSEKLEKIGREMVKCSFECPKINNDPSKGIIPRCLYYEKRAGSRGVIAVGLNPGKAKEKEKDFYKANNGTYNAFVEFFGREIVQKHKYYKETKKLLDLLGLNGPIVWTELVKCQCKGKNGDIAIQTFRTCINRYLKKEIELFPDFTIVAIGKTAFNFCAISFPQNFVIGIPHTSGSYGSFYRLLNKAKANPEKYKRKIAGQKDVNNNLNAIFLD
jgi:hypothetical protein